MSERATKAISSICILSTDSLYVSQTFYFAFFFFWRAPFLSLSFFCVPYLCGLQFKCLSVSEYTFTVRASWMQYEMCWHKTKRITSTANLWDPAYWINFLRPNAKAFSNAYMYTQYTHTRTEQWDNPKEKFGISHSVFRILCHHSVRLAQRTT